MKDKKSIIDIYRSDIYQINLVVANKYTTLEELKELYEYSDNKELDDRILDGTCTTSTIIDKKTNQHCILVKYNRDSKVKTVNKKLDLINTCSHEATHVALDIYETICQDICFCTPEPFCYLTGWATECIYKTLTKKK